MRREKAGTGARYASEKRVLRCAQNDNQKGKCRSRFPSGMTERKAKAKAKAKTNAGISPLRRAKGRAAPVEMTALWV
jgi:hypothetical protein